VAGEKLDFFDMGAKAEVRQLQTELARLTAKVAADNLSAAQKDSEVLAKSIGAPLES